MQIRNSIILSVLVTLILSSFIIWYHLIRVRLPKNLVHLEEIKFQVYLIGSLSFSFLLLTFYYLLRLLKIIPKENSKISLLMFKLSECLKSKPFFVGLYKLIEEHIMEGPKNAYNWLFKYIYVRAFIEKLQGIIIYRILKEITKLYIIGLVLPESLLLLFS